MQPIHYSHPALASLIPGCARCSGLRINTYESCWHKEKSRRMNVSKKRILHVSSDILVSCPIVLVCRAEIACTAIAVPRGITQLGELSLSNSHFVLLTRLLVRILKCYPSLAGFSHLLELLKS